MFSNGEGAEKVIQELESPGPPIGIVPEEEFPTLKATVPADASLFVFSDGAIEIWETPKKLWGMSGLAEFVRGRNMTGRASLEELYTFVKTMSKTDVLADDFSTVLARLP